MPCTATGWLNGDERWAALRQATLLALPSSWPEPFGLVGLEAAALGIPAVAFDVGGVREWLRPGVNGYLAPADPPRASTLADALVDALSDGEALKAMGCRAVGVAREMSLDRHLDRLEEIFSADHRDACAFCWSVTTRAIPRLGSTKVLVKLQEEFRALGHVCDLVLADDLGVHPRNAHLRRALAPMSALAAVRRAFRANGPYDVVDVASAEGAVDCRRPACGRASPTRRSSPARTASSISTISACSTITITGCCTNRGRAGFCIRPCACRRWPPPRARPIASSC